MCRSAWVQQCRELLGARDLWSQIEAAAPGAAAELKQLTGILAGVEASCCDMAPSGIRHPFRA